MVTQADYENIVRNGLSIFGKLDIFNQAAGAYVPTTISKPVHEIATAQNVYVLPTTKGFNLSTTPIKTTSTTTSAVSGGGGALGGIGAAIGGLTSNPLALLLIAFLAFKR